MLKIKNKKFNTYRCLLTEFKNFYNYFYKTPPKNKNIIFYTEHQGYYPYFEGLINELICKNKRTICYVTSNINDPILNLQKLPL